MCLSIMLILSGCACPWAVFGDLKCLSIDRPLPVTSCHLMLDVSVFSVLFRKKEKNVCFEFQEKYVSHCFTVLVLYLPELYRLGTLGHI